MAQTIYLILHIITNDEKNPFKNKKSEKARISLLLISQTSHLLALKTFLTSLKYSEILCIMARGQQKLQSQAKAAEKISKLKKQQGHSATDQKKAAQKALVHVCAICKAQMPDPKTYKQHFENKHPKNDLPEDLKTI
ncbi:jg7682 [Pararge aegeria aegeria]|uniref:Jg7682 protein n=2 Tax=Pararge aegeria TaxID=116150 RepID=A0A8S4QWI8_9NEOP|nr:jg7682 [Pararge aegeria aegeria]